MARLVTKTAKIEVETDSVRLAAVADTHSQPHAATLERLRELKPTAILHGGDIGDLEVLEELGKVAPVYAVRGNIDTRAKDLPDVLTIDVGALRILLTHIAVYGPKLRSEVAKLAREAKAPLVVCGHSHVPFIGVDKGITVFNPGSVGPRRFSLPICLGAIDIGPAGVKLRHVNCETGQTWLPPG
ncbi:MAG TPA: metallophosphoesterase family protein [Kofleriaceae bacterium]|nr:metallophosphoesterase family protein [Kofleriaceae bacterium]